MFLPPSAPWWFRGASIVLLVLVVVDLTIGDGRLMPFILVLIAVMIAGWVYVRADAGREKR